MNYLIMLMFHLSAYIEYALDVLVSLVLDEFVLVVQYLLRPLLVLINNLMKS